MLTISQKIINHSVLPVRTEIPRVTRDIKAIQKIAYGASIAVTEHDEWRMHQQIVKPSFSENNNVFVWELTITVILSYFT